MEREIHFILDASHPEGWWWVGSWAQGGTAVGENGEGLEWGWGTLSLAEPLE